MADFSDLLKSIKQVARETVDNDVPAIVCFGEVQSDNPLQVLVDQKLLLDSDQLILSRNVTDFSRDETVDHMTENRAGGSQYALFESHNHQYKGRKEFKIHNKLQTGDQVILLRVQGGQKFVILDRIGK